jgi:hypothetical protein
MHRIRSAKNAMVFLFVLFWVSHKYACALKEYSKRKGRRKSYVILMKSLIPSFSQMRLLFSGRPVQQTHTSENLDNLYSSLDEIRRFEFIGSVSSAIVAKEMNSYIFRKYFGLRIKGKQAEAIPFRNPQHSLKVFLKICGVPKNHHVDKDNLKMYFSLFINICRIAQKDEAAWTKLMQKGVNLYARTLDSVKRFLRERDRDFDLRNKFSRLLRELDVRYLILMTSITSKDDSNGLDFL